MNDYMEMQNLFDDTVPTEATQYVERNFEYIMDQNNGNYQSGQIIFTGQNLSGKQIVWSDAYHAFTLAVTAPAGVSWTSSSILAFKNGLWGAYYGISIKTSTGVQLVNDQGSLPLANFLRHFLENTGPWLDGAGQSLEFRKETDATNGSSNTAFQLQASHIKSQYIDTTNNILYFECQVPLPDIHPFFAGLNFPIPNFGLDVSFYMNFGPNTEYSIMLLSDAAAGSDNTKLPSITISTSGAGNTLSRSRLYYPVCLLPPAEASSAASKIKAGFSKTLEFRVTDIHRRMNTPSSAGSSVSDLVSTSCVLPQRLHILTFPAGALGQTFAGYKTPMVPTLPITNLKVLVNNTQYTSQIPQYRHELWKYVQENLPFNSQNEFSDPLFTYQDYISVYKGLNSMDISRIKGRELKPFEGVSIQTEFQFAPGSSGNCDVYYIVERLMKVRLDISHNDCQAFVGVQV